MSTGIIYGQAGRDDMYCVQMEKDPTAALMLRPPRRLVERIKKAADAFGKPSHNQVAVDILETFLDYWIEAEHARQAVLNKQREAMVAALEGQKLPPEMNVRSRPAAKKAAAVGTAKRQKGKG